VNTSTFYFVVQIGWRADSWSSIEGATASFAGACPVPNWVNYCRAVWAQRDNKTA